jgi:hypothetical protein
VPVFFWLASVFVVGGCSVVSFLREMSSGKQVNLPEVSRASGKHTTPPGDPGAPPGNAPGEISSGKDEGRRTRTKDAPWAQRATTHRINPITPVPATLIQVSLLSSLIVKYTYS